MDNRFRAANSDTRYERDNSVLVTIYIGIYQLHSPVLELSRERLNAPPKVKETQVNGIVPQTQRLQVQDSNVQCPNIPKSNKNKHKNITSPKSTQNTLLHIKSKTHNKQTRCLHQNHAITCSISLAS
jgi:hypothetical protein